jgi:hypothetical protein
MRRGAVNPVSPVGCLTIAAPILALFRHATCPTTYECHGCHQVFERSNRPAQIVILIFFLLIMACFVYALVIGQLTLSNPQAPEHP